MNRHPLQPDFDAVACNLIALATRGVDPTKYGVIVIDSITHLWDACKAAYSGKVNRNGAIPFQAWTAIKKPYRELMHRLLSLPIHVLICGRQGVDYGEDETTGELTNLGYKMRAEGETAYEPDLLLRMEQQRPSRKQAAVPMAHVEKDRTGILAGQAIAWPTFDNIAKPLLGLLGTTQVAAPSEDEVGLQDADALDREEAERGRRSVELAAAYTQRFQAADSAGELQQIGRELTPGIKTHFTAKDLERVRKAFAARLAQLQAAPAAEVNGAAIAQ